MFKILKNEDGKKDRGTIIDEENEASSDEEKKKDSPSKGGPAGTVKEEDSGSDSDPLEGELTGKEQAALFSDIKGTIDQFETFFTTGVLKKRGKSNVQKVISEKKRDVKSPLSNPILEQKSTKEVSPVKKIIARTEPSEPQAPANVPIKSKGSFKKM